MESPTTLTVSCVHAWVEFACVIIVKEDMVSLGHFCLFLKIRLKGMQDDNIIL